MDRKKLINVISYTIVFFVTIIVLDKGYGYIATRLENYVTQKSPNSMLMEHTMWNVDADVLIIGSSEANHSYVCQIIQDTLGLSVYNCGRDGSGFLYQNCMIDGALKRYSPRLIVWAIYPTFLDNPDDLDMDRLSRLNPFYDTNEKCHDAINTKSEFESIKMLSWSYRYNSRLLTYLYKSITPDYDFDRGYAPLKVQKRGFELDSVDYKGCINDAFLSLFDETLQACEEKGIKIALVITPRYETGNYSCYPSYSKIVSVANKYPNAFIVDEFYQDSCLMKKEYYADNSHLLEKGAELFTSKLVQKLKKY